MDSIKDAAKDLYPLILAQLPANNKKYGSRTFQELDEWRCLELPTTLEQRFEEHESTWLTKDELALLMDWKLAKGKFRPTLPKLIQSNAPETVKSVTKDGLQLMLDYFLKSQKITQKEYTETVKKSIKKLSELRGVGPATASLMLSLLVNIHSRSPPFFSDESFLYYVDPLDKIKYNVKEYTDMLLPVYFELADDSVTFDTLERGAWALKTYALKKDYELANIDYNTDDTGKYVTPIKKEEEKKLKRKTEEAENDLKKRKKSRK